MAFLCLLSCFTLLGVSTGHGKSASLPELSIRPRIINGKDAHPGDWPWHVVLLNENVSCGASLISSNWVITAAHCNATTSSWVVVGLYDTRFTDDIQGFTVAQVFTHPLFNSNTLHNDISLLKLSTGVHFNSRVSPLRLPRVADQFLPRSLCIIMGFGSIDSNGTMYPDQLQEAIVTIMSSNRCKYYWKDLSLDDILCAQRRGASPGSGDSGGPVVCWKNRAWTLVGITSFACGEFPTNRPFVATRVSAYLPWIEQILAHN